MQHVNTPAHAAAITVTRRGMRAPRAAALIPSASVRAFTLIELLIVLTIIALLIAILLPALRASRIAAQSVRSLSNVRQIGAALRLYANDNRASLPLCRRNGPPGEGYSTAHLPWEAWAAHLRRRGRVTGYIDDYQVFWGPGRDMTFAKDHFENNHNFARPGYAPYVKSAMPLQSAGVAPLRFGDPNNPPASAHLLLVEAFDNSFWYPQKYDGRWGIQPALLGDDNGNYLYTYHGDAPRVYVDGHGAAGDSAAIGWQAEAARGGQWTVWPATALDGAPWFRRD